MAPHFSVLAWRIQGTGEPGGLLSMGLHRVGHDWSDLAAAAVQLVLTPMLIYHHENPRVLKHYAKCTLHVLCKCNNTAWMTIHLFTIWFKECFKPTVQTCRHMKLLQSCLTLCNPTNCSPPGFSVHGILQARVLEWIAIPFSREIFLTLGLNLDLLHCRQILLPSEPPGKPITLY